VVAAAGGSGGGGGGTEPEAKKEEKEEEKVCFLTQDLDFARCSPFAIRRSLTMTWALACSTNTLWCRNVD
jgi:hypothetical protein